MTMQRILRGRMEVLVCYGLITLVYGLMALSETLAEDSPKIVMPQPAAHWRVEYEFLAKAAPTPEDEALKQIFGEPQKRQRTVEYKVFKDTAEITTTYEDGTKEVVYMIGDYLYRHDRRLNKDVIEPVVQDDINHRCRNVYPEFAFPLSPYYVGKVEAFSRPCFYYRSDRVAPDSDALASELWEAWVSAETGRPVAFRLGKVLTKFEFLPPPTTAIVLPQPFADLARATFKPSPPPGSMAGMKR